MTDQTKIFLDSNIIIYALGDDLHKKEISQNLLEQEPILSTQVLTEVSQVCLKKFKLPHELVSEWIGLLHAQSHLVNITPSIIQNAIQLAKKYQYSFYDSLIIAASLHAEVSTLYSEDMQHGQKISGLTILNPFL